jgi:ubiquinone/menaquinone biosynthesis C-methylase UbiE
VFEKIKVPQRDTVADYNHQGSAYSGHRVADPRITAQIKEALGDSKVVLNVGAGTGSYEPEDRHVLAVEPSAVMRRQRPHSLPPAINGTAENLPFDDGVFDASMAILAVHHWPDIERGLREVRRVARGPIVLMVFDPYAETQFWLQDYVPEIVAVERSRQPSLDPLKTALGGDCQNRSGCSQRLHR